MFDFNVTLNARAQRGIPDAGRDSSKGSVLVEYAVVMFFVVVWLAALLSPEPVIGNFTVYDLIRELYARTVVVISMPWL